MRRFLRWQWPALTAFLCLGLVQPSISAPAAEGSSPVAATLNGNPVTLAEVDAKAASALLEVRQQEYRARKDALEALLQDQILDLEAKSRGTTPDAMIKTEITDKVTKVTPDEVKAFYEENKARVGDVPLEQLSDRIGEHLNGQRQAAVEAIFYEGLRKKYVVKVLLDPPRVAVSVDDNPSKGPANAPITIVAFSDFECPYCSRAQNSVDEVMAHFGDKVRLVYRDFPLGFHANAQGAAEASQCAHEQGKYWQMHKVLFAHHDALQAEGLEALAKEAGLDKKKFKTCMKEGRFKAEVAKDMEDATKLGVTGTPTFFINGVVISGAQDAAAFEDVIDGELERLGIQ